MLLVFMIRHTHPITGQYFEKKKRNNIKSLGPIDRKFHGHGKTMDYVIKQCSRFCKYTNISIMEKKRTKKITCKQKVGHIYG